VNRRRLIKVTGAGGAVIALGGLSGAPAWARQSGGTIKLWDTLNEGTRKHLIENKIGKSFSESHDGAKIDHRGWTTEDLTGTLPRSVDSGQGPDISQVNNGEGLMGPMIRAGQLVSLVRYVEKYGWDTIQPHGLLARNMYTADGKQLGQGQLWGMSMEAEIVGFYHNRKIFNDNGIELPKTFADLEAAMQKLKDAGQTPLMFGNLDKWPAIHLFGDIQGTMTTRAYLDGLIYRTGKESFEDTSMIDAATKLKEWVDKGYLLDGYSGVSSDDAVSLFSAGQGAMLMQGSWSAGDIEQALGADGGFFLMPPREAGGKVLNVGGVGIPYSIIKGTKNPDLDAELIDYLCSDEVVGMIVDAGVLPARAVPKEKIKPDTVTGDLYTAFSAALEGDAIGHYLDWASPTMYDTLTAQLQALLAGKVDPKTFVANLQADYAKSFSS
jgi:raffinose/stachyose/melibiose transport system substrate-binding protein